MRYYGLRRQDIDFKNHKIMVRRSVTKDKQEKVIIGKDGKTQSATRTIDISPFLVSLLKKNTNFDYLFKQPNGKFTSPSSVNSNFRRICKDCNVLPCIYELHRKGKIIKLKNSKAHVHMIRHTVISRARERGVDIKALQSIVGHRRSSTLLDVYTSVSDDFKKKEADKLSEYYDELQLR